MAKLEAVNQSQRPQAVQGPPTSPTSDGAGGMLAAHGICKRFGAVTVLDDVSFRVNHGEFVTLLGPSGCGKTTLLRILAGLELPDHGTVRLDGRNITHLPANHRPVNMVFQSYALFPHLNVYENIAFGLRARKLPADLIARRIDQVLGLLQLEPFTARSTGQLSGGQKQRVALARALVNEPQVLLLDEPLSALDAKLRAELQLELRRIQRSLARTFILVTHDQEEAMSVSDRILVMQHGRILQEGPPADVYERPLNRFVAEFLGLANLIPGRRSGLCVQTPLGPLRPRTPVGWESGTLAIRPEWVEVCHADRPENAVGATVREVVYRGDHLDVFFSDCPLRARVGSGAAPSVGQHVWLHLPSEHLEVLVD